MDVVSVLLCLGGFAHMALSMPKHHRQVFTVEPTRRRARTLRVAAWLLLGVSLGIAVSSEGASLGVVLWTGLLTVSALPVTLVLTYWPRALTSIGVAATFLAIVLFTAARMT